MPRGLGPALSYRQSDRRCAPLPDCVIGDSGFAIRKRAHSSLAWIWRESESFNKFRGTAWMPSPCRDCPERERDFGGCRCQAALLTGSASNTDPVCDLSSDRHLIEEVVGEANRFADEPEWQFRRNPTTKGLGQS